MKLKWCAFGINAAVGSTSYKLDSLKRTVAANTLRTKPVMGRRKSALAVAIVGGVLMLAAGCMQTQVIDQTMPPYASISDEGREPPKPPPSDDSPGIMSRIGSAIAQLFW